MARTASLNSTLLDLMESTEGENYYTGLRFCYIYFLFINFPGCVVVFNMLRFAGTIVNTRFSNSLSLCNKINVFKTKYSFLPFVNGSVCCCYSVD